MVVGAVANPGMDCDMMIDDAAKDSSEKGSFVSAMVML